MPDDPVPDTVEKFSGNYDRRFDPYFHWLGRLTSTWSSFEFNLNDAIWELANLERKAGTCLTSQMIGPGPRFRCLVALLNLRQTPTEIVRRINALSADADAASRQRNRYIHDPMVLDDTTGTISRMETTADRAVKHEVIPITLEEIKKLYSKIDHLNTRFNFLYAHVRAKTPPWPRIQFEQSKGIVVDRHPLTPSDTPLEPEPPPRSFVG